jgi:hypothetical protein
MEKKTIYLTEEQYKEIYETALREALIVNIDLVKSIVKYLNKHFKPIKYDDINPDGEVVQPYAIQMLSMDGEPLQTISVDRLLTKIDNVFCHKIKDDNDRHRFYKQIVDDWLAGNISKEGVLSVNVIKEKKTLNQPTYLGELIDLTFKDILKTPLVENNHHVTYIDEYIDIICGKFKKELEKNRTLNNMSLKFTEDDFAYIPNKFFTECVIIVNYQYDTKNWYDGGYNSRKTIVDEDNASIGIENAPIEKKNFKRIYFEIVIDLFGNSFFEIMKNLKVTIGHEMTHALQHIRMKMNHNELFTDENYLKSYRNIVKDADAEKDDNILKGRFASFLYYTDVNERKANVSEFYNEIGDITENDIKSRESIIKILEGTKMWEIIKIMGKRLQYYNTLNDDETKEKLISYYNIYFDNKTIKTYKQFKRIMNGRWNSFYGGLTPKLISMIREKAAIGQHDLICGPHKPDKIK